MNLKSLLVISVILLNFFCFSKEKKEIEMPDHWEIISRNLDTTIAKGYSKVKVFVVNSYFNTPLKETKIFINTNLLVGETDSLGIIEGLIPFGTNRFCADTKEGNSFTTNYNFLDQYTYIVKVVMTRHKQIPFQFHPDIKLSNYWEIVSSELDSTLELGYSKIRITVEDINNYTKLENVIISLNTTLELGKTDSNGVLNSTILSGDTRLCADKPFGSSFATNYDFKSQYTYVIKIKMYLKQIYYKPSTVLKKPVIYLYPTKTQPINVKVVPKGDFVFTYPSYPENGWSIIGHPNGEIKYKNRTYNYLFWEANSYTLNDIDISDGFIVHSDTLVQFLERALTTVGLSDIEQADFITYWAPKLEQNKLNFIHFEFNEGYEKYISKMKITPKPESLIRIFMLYKAVNKPYKTETQNIPTLERKGFTVIEWGGAHI